ncbi:MULTISPECIES: hypothetical protein [unclassified Leifsonia]|uniref:hypothetical protein n=1 Tax=unclassified Leifsonia TaxID=2663824 RepID=UPI0007007035|nr:MULTISPECIES: hypothetical protein [unclassified Leifsonia]KQX06675.1 hypothetical protein ASC59_02160 [Leifsonia sp. Root1293]KRA10959.1 hypothetical protein ASD61_02160 [Leifsonia sp. Root60]
MTLFSDDPRGPYTDGIDDDPARDPRLIRSRRVSPGRRIVTWVVVAGVAAAAAWAFANPVRLTDQIVVWTHQPQTAAVQFAQRAGMTDEARFTFYASVPAIEGRAEFNASCNQLLDQGVTLGCYVPLGRAIHLFEITDERLDGLQVVTAAHEMLHAAWARMSFGEQTEIASLLEDEAARLGDDRAFLDKMALYAGIDDAGRLSELHSILGTEFTQLSPALEEHYGRYFEDREALVALHVTSEAVFSALQAQSEALVAELDALRAGIDADSQRYSTESDRLSADIDDFNARWDEPDAGTQEQFDAERATLLDRQAVLDALYDSITARRSEFDEKAAELEQMNVQVEALNSAIDSRMPPVGE